MHVTKMSELLDISDDAPRDPCTYSEGTVK